MAEFPVPAAYGVLTLGRLLRGWGESLAIVSPIASVLGGTRPHPSGRVFVLVSMGFYGTFAVGSLIGVGLLDRTRFSGTMLACALVPLAGLAMMLPLASVSPLGGEHRSLGSIIGHIWQPA